MIAAGWESTPQNEIPQDWREPERIHSAERRQAISLGMQRYRGTFQASRSA
jgi:hypothetical protein